eukprot:CAMPEP_0182474158 /NCGR_PEP_ID=MMETSP1319-20130603/25189_1 /TAXON_ID=172717 /ORGANISM="Bolidomonas pacifica, Strain RCC208" /LENGTH=81 /DNA_ID=CAMNT_0024675025 /DNA_START=16 /DNA_END=261 /DNA_ORIENTATION=-
MSSSSPPSARSRSDGRLFLFFFFEAAGADRRLEASDDFRARAADLDAALDTVSTAASSSSLSSPSLISLSSPALPSEASEP